MPNTEKEQFIQNCLHDHNGAEEIDLSVEKAKMFFEANYCLLNKDQKHGFDYIKDLIVTSNRDGLLIFLDAPGGTGKFECAGDLDDNERSQGGDLCCCRGSCYSSLPWQDHLPQIQASYHPSQGLSLQL